MSRIFEFQRPGRRCLSLFSLIAGLGCPLAAVAAPETISIEIDRTADATPLKRETAGEIEKLERTPLICLNLRIRLDGSDQNTLRSSFQEQDANPVVRRSVECGPALTGSLQMGPGVEYYVVTQGVAGNRIDLSIYPGSRTEHISNDVACAFDGADSKSAWFNTRGLYQPVTNRYADVGADGKPNGRAIVAIQLRPVTGTREDAAGCSP